MFFAIFLLLSIFNSNVDGFTTSNIDSNGKHHPDKFHLIFEEIGQMASSMTYIFSTMRINLTDISNTIDNHQQSILTILQTVRNISEKEGDNFEKAAHKININTTNHPSYIKDLKDKLAQNLLIHLSDLKTEQQRIKDITAHLPLPVSTPIVGENTPRPKRFVLQMLFGVLGTFMSIFDQKQYDKLQKAVTTTKEIQKRLIQVVNNQAQAINDIKHSLDKFNTKLDMAILLNPANMDAALQSSNRKIRLEIDRVYRALQAAQYRRLALDFLDADKASDLYTMLTKTAKDANCNLLITQPADIFQLELSYFFNGDIITLLLHVPMVPKGSLLRLVKLHPFPLPIAGNYSIVPDVSNDILALSISEQRLSAQFPAANLLGCLQTNRVYMCENQGVLNKKLSQSCLGALYNQDSETAKTLCPMKIIHAEEVVYKLKDNIHLLYTPLKITIPITCPDKSYEKWVSPGVTEFQLDPGCKAETLHHMILTDSTVMINSGLTHIVLEKDSNMGLPDMSKEQLESELNILKQKGLYNPTLNDFIDTHNEIDVIGNISKQINDIKSFEQFIVKKFQSDLNNIVHSQIESNKQAATNQLSASTSKLTLDLTNIDDTKTSKITSIIIWTISFAFIISIIILLSILYFKFHYQISTFYKAFKVRTLKETRTILLKIFTTLAENEQSLATRTHSPA